MAISKYTINIPNSETDDGEDLYKQPNHNIKTKDTLMKNENIIDSNHFEISHIKKSDPFEKRKSLNNKKSLSRILSSIVVYISNLF